MSTWAQDHAEELKTRPYLGRPSWELKNTERALSSLPWLNTPADTARLAQVKAELKARRARK